MSEKDEIEIKETCVKIRIKVEYRGTAFEERMTHIAKAVADAIKAAIDQKRKDPS